MKAWIATLCILLAPLAAGAAAKGRRIEITVTREGAGSLALLVSSS